MTNPTIQIDDEIREMTDEEFATYQIHVQAAENRKAEEAAKEQAKASAEAKLAALGLTTEEIEALKA
jgi:hypothetical protein